jgi:AcrR family transcriptional regulator
MTEPAVDGRRQRSERSRTAVIEALLALYDEGTVRPTVAQVAERSGVSERSVFRHFTDMEDLASAALERQLAEVRPFFAAPEADGTQRERIEALVAQRVALHGRMANLARAAAHHAASSSTVAEAVAGRRRLLRQQVEVQFAPELRSLGPADADPLLAALDQAFSLEALDYLAAPSGGDRSRAELADVLRTTATALLATVPVQEAR